MNQCKLCRILIHGWEDICESCCGKVNQAVREIAEAEEERIALNDYYARQAASIPLGDTPAGAKDRQEGGNHYTDMGIGPWDIIDTWPFEQQVGFYRGNALKYLMRMGTKGDDDLQEARKAAHYNERLIEILKGF